MVILKRYAPLVAIAAIQVLIVALAPSKSPTELAGGAGPGPAVAEGEQEFLGDDPLATAGPDETAGPGGGPGGGTTGPGGGRSARERAGADGVITREEAAVGSREHCVGGRQWDPKIWPYSPPCIPKFGGSNGPAPYRGVTKDTIKIVFYDANLGQAVDALLTAQGSNPTPQQQQTFHRAVEKFVNERYELYGRKIVIDYWQGQCESVPPNYPCLRNEMRRIVQERNPFWVIWNTSLASPAFDELSRLKVMNSGGWGFRDVFSQQRRPYHWDVLMGGSQQVEQVGEWWCKRLDGHKARYAGETGNNRQSQNPPTNDIRSKTRVLGVISTDDPENKLAVAEFKSIIREKCGGTVAHEYYYAQDITTAQQQRSRAVAEMREAPESTTIMCFCDLVAPIFLYQTCQEQGYFPEHVIVGTGFMDADRAAQAYDTTLPPPGTQFHNAFGLAQQPKAGDMNKNTAAQIYALNGGSGAPYISAEVDWQYYGMVANLIQMAGPVLTPANVEKGASALAFQPGGNSDERAHQRSFNPSRGDYTWIDNMREVYWSTQQNSPFNGEPGTYVTLNLGRQVWFGPGQYLSGELTSIPAKPR